MSGKITNDKRPDTFPKLLIENARIRGAREAVREKDYGIWQSWTWAQVHDEIRALANGFAAKGLRPGDKVAIVGDNRPRLYWTITAAQAVGAIPVPVYQDAVAEELQFVLEHAGARVAVVEDQEQVDKILEIKDRCPELEFVVYDNSRGMRHYDQDFLIDYDVMQEAGRTFEAANPAQLDDNIAAGKGADIAIMLYTSGTTGRPKGVMLTHDNLVITAERGVELEGLTDKEEILAYLPMAWVGDNVFSVAQAYVAGFCVNCPESGDTVMTDMREIGPSYFFAPPRIFENLLTTVMIRMEDASKIKQKMFHYFMDLAKRVGTDILDGKPVSGLDKLKYQLGRYLVYEPLKNTLGFSRIKLAYTAGEAIGPDIFDFYRSLGINIKQLYGQTEAAVFISVQPDGQVFADTVGTPFSGVDIEIADTGEVLYRGAGVFQAYYKNEDATRNTKTAEGWVHTGDAGFFDDHGHLRIIDRAKDVGKLTSGDMFAPKYIENKLKFFPHIKEAVAFGDKRGAVCAFINIDLEAVGNWAERRGLAYTGYTDLAGQAPVYDLIQDCVEKVNADLSKDSHLSGSQISRYLILHKELDADDGELTRTRKVRRNFIEERYGDLIGALYSNDPTVHVEAQVTYEDGRTTTIIADLEIREAERYAAEPAMKAS